VWIVWIDADDETQEADDTTCIEVTRLNADQVNSRLNVSYALE
jgi:hypothetical protein